MMRSKLNEFKSIVGERWFSQMRDLPIAPDLLKMLRHPSTSISEDEFKWHLADAILNKRFDINEYEKLTDMDFENKDEVAADLTGLWRLVFKDDPIRL